MLHSPEIRKQRLSIEIKSINSEAMNGTIVNYNMHINSYPINEELVTVQSMSVCINKMECLEQMLEISNRRTCGIC